MLRNVIVLSFWGFPLSFWQPPMWQPMVCFLKGPLMFYHLGSEIQGLFVEERNNRENFKVAPLNQMMDASHYFYFFDR